MKLTTHYFTDYAAARRFVDEMIACGHDAWFTAGGLGVVVRKRRV